MHDVIIFAKKNELKKLAYYLSVPWLYLVAILPFPLLYLLSDFVKIILFDLVGYRKKVILSNLRASFPEKSDTEIKIIANKFYHNFTDMLLECIKMLTISTDELDKHFVITNPEILEHYYAKNKGVIGIVGHMINWELAIFAGTKASSKDMIVIYKTLANEYFDKLVLNMRSRFGTVMVPMKSTLRTLVKYHGKPYTLVLAGDQYPGKGDGIYKTTFLNQETYVFKGAENTSKKFDNAVVFFDLRRVKRGCYTITYTPLVEDAKNTSDGEITELHVRCLEKAILETPDTWLWSHRRWK